MKLDGAGGASSRLEYVPDKIETSQFGMVHRLDKDTTGSILVATSEAAFKELVRDRNDKRWTKIYVGLVHGWIPLEQWRGRITTPLKRRKLGDHGHFVTKCEDCWQHRLDYLRSLHPNKSDVELERLDRGTYHFPNCKYTYRPQADEWECCEKGGSTMTSYEALHYYETNDTHRLPLTLVKFKITGGRTHQIRVHALQLAQNLKMNAWPNGARERAPA